MEIKTTKELAEIYDKVAKDTDYESLQWMKITDIEDFTINILKDLLDANINRKKQAISLFKHRIKMDIKNLLNLTIKRRK